ncbi:MAG TPA: hypothetical protein VJ576_18040 [Rhodocyclaceae bacterium]|nr:hypothetical protein [Rhodocyclaceae bacterium]
MHRVITKFRDRHGQVIIERGPWHPSREDAERWADLLRSFGYQVQVESHGNQLGGGADHQDLAKALSSMA